MELDGFNDGQGGVVGGGYGSGKGNGDGYGSGKGNGDGYGDGYSKGFGLGGAGDGYGDGYSKGFGFGSGYGDGFRDGSGNGNGDGYGDGYSKGFGLGGAGHGYGDGYGEGFGFGSGYGDGFRDGSGNGFGDEDLLREYMQLVEFPADLALYLPNSEFRRIAIELIGPDRLFKELGTQVVHSDVDGIGNPRRLLRIPMADARAGYIQAVEVVCPTTGRVYHLGVRPHVKTCQEAVASTFGLSADEYRPWRET